RDRSRAAATLCAPSFAVPPRARTATLFPYTALFRSATKTIVGFRIRGAPPRHGSPHPGLDQLEPPEHMNERCISNRCQAGRRHRSEEHTSELQSRFDLVCRLLLEKKKQTKHARDRKV